MLDLEQLFTDLHRLESELNEMGAEAVLDERDDGMPEFHFGEFGGGLAWWVNKGFYLTIWAGNLSDVYDTNIFHEFRHELIRRLADQYERKAREVRGTWAGLIRPCRTIWSKRLTDIQVKPKSFVTPSRMTGCPSSSTTSPTSSCFVSTTHTTF